MSLTHSQDRAHTTGKRSGHFPTARMGRSASPPQMNLTAAGIQSSIGRGAKNDPADIKSLMRIMMGHGTNPLTLLKLRDPEQLAGWITDYQRDVLGFRSPDGRIDPGGKTIRSIEDGVGLKRELKKEKSPGEQEKQPDSGPGRKQHQPGEWAIPSLLSKSQYFSQAHPSLCRGVQPVPRSVAFSGALVKYDRGGSADIYDDAKTKWKSLSVEKREEKVYWRACKNTATFMAKQTGYADTGSAGKVETLIEKAGERLAAGTFEEGKSLLDRNLEAGIATVVGVDKGKKGLNANATDHFIVVVGRGEDEQGKFYTFFDPGRSHAAGHDLKQNRLYIDGTKISGNNGRHDYTLSEVRRMKSVS